MELIKQKGVYPYEYMNNFKKFYDCKLPSKGKFYSSLKNKGISDEDYQRAVDVWNVFDIKYLGEYHDLYLKTDVLLLCNVFEKFINICIEYYELDPDKENTYITYWDVNNLYGWAMSQYLPYDNFEWMSEDEINEVNFDLVSEDSKIGYILEADLKYPKNLHNLHNDYPLAPVKCKVSQNMLSDYSLDIAKNYGEVNKLIPNLKDKNGYNIHYRNFQMYKSLRMKVTKIHRVLKFSQADWLKDFVMFNTKKE